MRHLITLGLMICATSASADGLVAEAPPSRSIGIDGALVLPVGDYATAASFGLGALGRLELPVGIGFATVRTGVIVHEGGAASALTLVPIYGGYRLPIGDGGGYAAGELGVTAVFATVDTQLGRMSQSDSKLGLTLGGGWKHGALDLRAQLFSPDVNHATGLMATVGYDFASF